MPQSGSYSDPNYTVRQQVFLGNTIAGANGTSVYFGAPSSDLRIRSVAIKPVALTTAATTAVVLIGTATAGTIAVSSALGTNTYARSADLNALLPVGTMLAVKNGADATGTFSVWAELHLDPASSWTGP
jgi:hypothetical protein